LATDSEFLKIQQEAQQKYVAFIQKAKISKLSQIGGNLTRSLNLIFPDTKVNIDWVDEEGVTVEPPRALVKVTEEGYENTIDRCGHGLQRAFILTMFQELAIIQSSQTLEELPEDGEKKEDTESEGQLGLIIGIEEPELYQHPDRQRHLATTLMQLTERGIEGVGNIQVVYSTHSPLMVDYQRFNQLRIFRKADEEKDKPKQTKITLASLRNVASLIETAKSLTQNSITDGGLQQRLISLMTPWMNEGFFAKLVVIVEGIKDRALIYGYAIFKGVGFDREGISVIPCSGKDHMTEAISLFKSLEIPQYAIWDSDLNPSTGRGRGEDANRNIQRCYGCDPEPFPSKITDDFACVATDLEAEFRREIGEADFGRTLQEYSETNQLGKGSYVLENPMHISQLLSIFKSEGLESRTLEAIFEKIMEKANLEK
jgi:putative ATP-dependent endonuclease of OLD family